MSQGELVTPDRFEHPQGVGPDIEEYEWYRKGGFHPVHIGDKFDGRYEVVNKLGSGGYSTVWLARYEQEGRWVALKIVDALHSDAHREKMDQCRTALGDNALPSIVQPYRHFMFDGPNGRHFCIVLPVLGPSVAELSKGHECQLTPRFARRLARLATEALIEIHSVGLCHGGEYVDGSAAIELTEGADFTTSNLVLGSSLDSYDREVINALFGEPVTGALATFSGEIPGPEAPQYIVKAMDFLSTPLNSLTNEIKHIDFDQCFQKDSPPDTLLGTPLKSLAPEVAVGRAAFQASDTWALGCCIYHLRSGLDIFSEPFEVMCPADFIEFIAHVLDESLPEDWKNNTLWDRNGYPTRDTTQGRQGKFLPYDWGNISIESTVNEIWDEPANRAIDTGTFRAGCTSCNHNHRPFPLHFSNMVWHPKAVRVDNVYVYYINDEWPSMRAALPALTKQEVALLIDLLTKIFVLDPMARPTARQIIDHPWFHLDDAIEEVCQSEQGCDNELR